MRVTINLPDDVYEVARSMAAARHIPLGDAVADLVRQALGPELRIREGGPFPCFLIPEGAQPITLEQTLEAEEQP